MQKRVAILIIALFAGIFFASDFVLNTQEVFGYNKPWDQGHDSTNPDDPEDPEEPPEPPCDECEKVCYLSPVSCSNGNYIYKAQDVVIPWHIPLEITRVYNSRDNMRNGLFGYGWVSNLDMKLVYIAGESQNIAKILMPNGQRHNFIDNGDGSFSPPLGVFKTLFKNIDGTYILEEKDGTQYQFDVGGRLTLIADKNGNEVSISLDENGCPNIINDGVGRVINITKGPNGKISSIADFDGRTVSYGYDDNANLVSVTDPLGNLTTLDYDADHNLTKITDPEGKNIVSVTYNSKGEVSRLIDGEGDFSYAYISSNQTRKTDNSTGGVWIITYDNNKVVTAVRDPFGNNETKVFDSNYNLTSHTDKKGNTTTYTYDAQGNILTKTDALGNIWSYTYVDNTNWLETKTDPLGRVTLYQYDSDWNLAKIIQDFGGDLQNETVFAYDDKGNRISERQPLGNTTIYEYDSTGNLVKITDPLGHATTYSYDQRGNVLRIVDANGHANLFTYDLRDQLAAATDALGFTTQFTYDANGNRVSKIDEEGNTWTYAYDAHNRLVQQTDPLGNTTTYAYDVKGNLTSLTDAGGHKTTYSYDSMNRRIRETDALGWQKIYVYDAEGYPLSRSDENGNITQYGYDALSRLTSMTDALGGVTSYTYDAVGNLLSVTDANGNVTTNTYDALDRLVQTLTLDTGTISYTYDFNDNLLTKTDAKNITTAYVYDPLNRLSNIQFPDSTQNIAYNYDGCPNGIGRRCQMIDSSGTKIYEYDERGDVVKQTKTVDGIDYTTAYRYTPARNLAGMTYPSGRVVNYNYSAALISSVEQVFNGTAKSIITDMSYSTNLLPSSIVYGNDLRTERIYDARNQLTSLKIGVFKELSYTRDPVNNVSAISDSLNPASNRTFSYDALSRLIAAAGPWGNIQYTYDHVGNRTGETTDTGVTNYTYNGNKLASATGEKVLNYTHDANGNMISENARQYVYNQNQRLIRAVENSNLLGQYVYNGKGQRAKKDANGKTVVYHYSINDQLIAESDSSGNVTVEYAYLHDQQVSRMEGAGIYFYHNDHIGSPILITDESNAIVWQGDFLPFGENFSITGSVQNNLRFPGQYYDSGTGLHYNWHRYYDPKIGRYVRADPLKFNGDSINFFSYADNNPITRIDPFGLSTQNPQNASNYDTSNCEGYKPYFDSRFCNGEEDPYPRNAYQCCKDFMQRYEGSKAVNCVAKCLIGKEANCQKSGTSGDRAKCRQWAHVVCYTKCGFFPYKWIPSSCWKIVRGN